MLGLVKVTQIVVALDEVHRHHGCAAWRGSSCDPKTGRDQIVIAA
jgi:hypothetical protein